jgi:hypothetical protein
MGVPMLRQLYQFATLGLTTIKSCALANVVSFGVNQMCVRCIKRIAVAFNTQEREERQFTNCCKNNMKIAAYVKSFDGKPLEPMHSYPRVKRFIRDGKAVIISYKPFVIQLTYELQNPITQPKHVGCDTGRTNIGVVAINNDGDVAYSAHVETCNKDVSKHMAERADHRHASRSGERKVRQRRAIANNTTFKDGDSRERILPQCSEPIVNNYITNSEARFANRKRPKGWLAPTARHLLHTILKSIDLACDLLPTGDITIEVTKWDFAKMLNTGIKNWEYQKGALFGFASVEDAVYERQNCK